MTEILIQKDVPVEMRDGVRLMADVYRPAVGGQYPVLLQRTAYGKDAQNTSSMLNTLRAAQEGYVVVIQDGRGRYTSGGEFAPFVTESQDGYDTVEWCAAQPWSNGRVGMYGTSYVGATQWLAAIAAPPNLQAVFPVMTAAEYHDGWVYQGGALFLAFASAWVAQFLAVSHLSRLGLSSEECRAEETRLMGAIERLRRNVSHLPMSDLPMLKRDGLAPYFYEWLRHPSFDDYWKRISIVANHDRVRVPAFNLGSWYDLFIAGPPRNFAGLRQNAATEEARRGQKLLMGPWTHNSPSTSVSGQRNFGWGATLVLEDLQMRWFDHWLKDRDTGMLDEPPVRLYVMNQGWRDEHEWPLARTEYTPFYFHSSGRANGLNGDGALSRDDPGAEQPDIFLYNPVNPTPTVGAGGVFDQRPAEERGDVLCYTSAPLVEPLEVTGPVRLVLHASSSTVDTDFFARLVDVSPDGYAANICDGILRARYRNSLATPELLEPAKPYELTIDLLVTSNVFLPGHRIRVDVASACFPKYDRNLNTGGPVAEARETLPAVQTVFHDSARPSHILLPVIPPQGKQR
jgi:putative CocE/NonD family hydrolase